MDIRRDADKGVGYIPFVYMMPAYRKQGLGVQLIGEAVSVYRPLGRKYLRLRCARTIWCPAVLWRYGFRKVSRLQAPGVPGHYEKYIGH